MDDRGALSGALWLAAQSARRQRRDIGAPTLLVFDAKLMEMVPRKDSGVVEVVKNDADRVIADRLKPDNAEAYYSRGLLYQSQHQHQFAIDDFSTALGLATQKAEPFVARALSYLAIGDNKAGEIARAVLARTGRSFREEKQDITAVEAVLPPLILGVLIGFFWAMLYLTAGDLESGKEVNTTGRRGPSIPPD